MARKDGTADADTFTGTVDVDYLYGYGGNDTLSGGDNNDVLVGGEGDDTLLGEAGDDTLYGGTGKDVLTGGDGHDTLFGEGGGDVMSGGAGNDYIQSYANEADQTSIDAGTGDDTLYVTGGLYTKLQGGDGVDTIHFGTVTLATFGAVNGFEKLARNGLINGTASSNTLDFSGLTLAENLGGMEVDGKEGNDVITGTTAIDNLRGGAGNDTLKGGAGGDRMEGGADSDKLYGGDDGDYLLGDTGNDYLYGDAGNDTLYGGADDDALNGGDGNDLLDDSQGNNKFYGGVGNDDIRVGGAAGTDQIVYGNDGDDKVTLSSGGTYSVLSGGSGIDTLSIHATSLTNFSSANGFERYEGSWIISGTAGADSLDFSSLQSSAPRYLNGGISVSTGAGADLIKGTAENDYLSGGTENDVIWGGKGNDNINGEQGDDELHGGEGDDYFSDYGGANKVWGDAGNDRIGMAGDADWIDGGSGNDIIDGGYGTANTLLGGSGDDDITSWCEGDIVDGGSGNDIVRVGGHKLVRAELLGGSGIDTLVVRDNGFHHITAASSQFELVKFDNGLWGTDEADVIDFGDFKLAENGGWMSLYAGKGDDYIRGVTSNDWLYGEDGDDTIEGGEGNDRINGGVTFVPGGWTDGMDIASYEHAKSAVTVSLATTNAQDTKGAGVDTLEHMEGLIGSAYNDTLTGDHKGNVLKGLAGNDTIDGASGDDAIEGGAGNDTLGGGSGSDIIDGGDGNDVIVDREGANTLSGGAGNDRITVGGATIYGQQLTQKVDGGAGNDVVTLESGFYEVIQGGEGTDTLNVKSATFASFGAENGFERYDGDFAIAGTAEANVLDFSTMYAAVSTSTVGVRVDALGGDDIVKGTSRADTILGGAGKDTLYGNSGDDILDGGLENDIVRGGSGNDTITDDYGDNDLRGDSGNDTITAGFGNDRIDGGDGDDTIDAGYGDNIVTGGIGNDTLVGFGGTAERLAGGDGDDRIVLQGYKQLKTGFTGGAGTDTLVIQNEVTLAGLKATGDIEKIEFASRFWGTDNADTFDLSGFTLVGGGATLDAGKGADTITGTAAADTLSGGEGDDRITGGAGADLLNGSDGADRLAGGEGDDTLDGGANATGLDYADYSAAATGVQVALWNKEAQETGGAGKDKLVNIEGIEGSAFNDTLVGDTAANTLNGNDGADDLRGGQGGDTLSGGNGADTVNGDEGADVIAGGEGNDVLNGGFGVDTIDGGAGDDTIYAGGLAAHRTDGASAANRPENVGVEVLRGGDGADTYVWRNATDLGAYTTNEIGADGKIKNVIVEEVGLTAKVEFRAEQGDRIDLSGLGFAYKGFGGFAAGEGSGIRYSFNAEGTLIEIDADGDGVVNAAIQLDRFVDLAEVAPGIFTGTNAVVGTEGDDILKGGAGNDTVRAFGGFDWLDGGAGDDLLLGGAGDDIAAYQQATAGVTVSLKVQGVAQDTIGAGKDTLVDIENLHGSEFNDVLTGNDNANAINGGGGDDTINAGKGNDWIDGGAGADTILLSSFDLKGFSKLLFLDTADQVKLSGFPMLDFIGREAFHGEFSTEIPKGPTWHPEIRYEIRDGDTIVQIDSNGDGNIDASFRIKGEVAVSYNDGTLRVTDGFVRDVTGTAGNDTWNGGTGNDKYNGALGDDTARGGEGKDTLYGANGNDTLYGGAGDDTLFGNNDIDYLDGGTGADLMYGGAGADRYVVDNAGDVVYENFEQGVPAAGQVDIVTSYIDYTLTDWVENLSLFGDLKINGTGNALDNTIWGSGGANTLWGLAGNDVLDGNFGADTMYGGIGDDTYWIDDAGDKAVELSGEGNDAVWSTITHTLGDNIENLKLIGDATIDGTGNALANMLTGNDRNNVLDGGLGDDKLFGGLGNDTLIGGDGKDTLDGGFGADTMRGGIGNDSYTVDDAGDVVVEEAGGGSDTIYASVSYTMSANVEVMNLTGVGDIDGTGNGSANTIIGTQGKNALLGGGGNDILNGNAGNDILFGGTGDDTLFGGAGMDRLTGDAGKDKFAATVKTDWDGDIIKDFTTGSDLIDFSRLDANAATTARDAFSFIGQGSFSGAAGEIRFSAGSGADGGLLVSVDFDGDGAGDVAFTVQGTTTLAASDFML